MFLHKERIQSTAQSKKQPWGSNVTVTVILHSHTNLGFNSVCCCACRGALQAGVIAYGLFIFTTKVETLISAQNLPAGYTVSTQTQLVAIFHLVLHALKTSNPAYYLYVLGCKYHVSATQCYAYALVASASTDCVMALCLQAANIAITVRTIIIGLLYLATFIFSANTLGLAGAFT